MASKQKSLYGVAALDENFNLIDSVFTYANNSNDAIDSVIGTLRANLDNRPFNIFSSRYISEEQWREKASSAGVTF